MFQFLRSCFGTDVKLPLKFGFIAASIGDLDFEYMTAFMQHPVRFGNEQVIIGIEFRDQPLIVDRHVEIKIVFYTGQFIIQNKPDLRTTDFDAPFGAFQAEEKRR